MTDGYGEGEARKFMAPLNRIILSPSPDPPPIAFVFLSETKVEDTALPIRRVTAHAIYDSKVDDIAPPLRHIPAQPQIIAAADSSNKGGSPLNPNLILIGGAAGVLLLIIIGCIVAACISRNKRKNRKPQYYLDPSTRKGNDYYIDGTPQKWGNHDHAPQKWQPPQATLMSTDMVSGPIAPLMPPPSPNVALGFNKSTFTYEELVTATGSFCQANLLGQGGFGYVHKGVLPTGKEIAVKSLKSGSGQGEREFQAEVDIISRVHHRHLVSLVGYCIAGEKRLLVYDFVANKTLEHHLYGKGVTGLNWPTRLKIALGSAKGLAYLHEDCHPRIIHRDIKAANILLDMKFEALVADFGLAKLNLDNNTHVSTRVMGTFGYLAPEYASSGKLTDKSDVFSYGVMLLEIITGRRPYDSKHYMDDSLVDWARPVLSHALSDGNYDELVDPRLNGNYDPVEMARMVACAAASVRHSARKRPKMSQIVRALAGDLSLEDLNEGMRPGQSMLYGSGSDYEDMHGSKSRRSMKKVALGSPDFSDEFSDQFSDTMGDFNHHRAATLGSDGLFSEDLNPVGNQRYGALSPY